MNKDEKKEYLGALTTMILFGAIALASIVKLIIDYGF